MPTNKRELKLWYILERLIAERDAAIERLRKQNENLRVTIERYPAAPKARAAGA